MEPPPSPAPQAEVSPAEVSRSEYPLTLTDALGEEVTFDSAPQRIISMSPPITETLFALGLEDRIAGVTRFCEYPEAAQQKEQIGGVADPSAEKIISLEPDVVFATVGSPMPVIETLRESGIVVFSVNPESYEEVAESITTIGQICDAQEKASEVAGEMRQTAAAIEAKTSQLGSDERPSVLFVVWLDPLHVAGPGTFIDDMLKVCGARNAAGETENPWKQYSLEMAVAADPDIIVMTTDHVPGAHDAEAKLKELREHEAWRGVAAVENGRIVMIEGDIVLQTNPRLAKGLELLAAGIHPELFGPQAAADSGSDHASH